MTSDPPAGIILAGGQSRRMGYADKTLLHLHQYTLLDHVRRRLAPQVSAIAINSNRPAKLFHQFHLPVIADTLPDQPGPLAGILAGMRWCAPHHPFLVSVPADTPLIPNTLVAHMVAAQNTPNTLVSVSSAGRQHPAIGLWPVALADHLQQWLEAGGRKIIAWTSLHPCTVVNFPVQDHDPFDNINTPADLARISQITPTHTP